MKLASQLSKLGTETAFAVSAAAAEWAAKGHKVYPFHLGDINIPTPSNIVEASMKAIADGYTGYCPGAGIADLRAELAADVGGKRGVHYSAENVSVQPGGNDRIRYEDDPVPRTQPECQVHVRRMNVGSVSVELGIYLGVE